MARGRRLVLPLAGRTRGCGRKVGEAVARGDGCLDEGLRKRLHPLEVDVVVVRE